MNFLSSWHKTWIMWLIFIDVKLWYSSCCVDAHLDAMTADFNSDDMSQTKQDKNIYITQCHGIITSFNMFTLIETRIHMMFSLKK